MQAPHFDQSHYLSNLKFFYLYIEYLINVRKQIIKLKIRLIINYLRYLTDGYSPRVAQSVAICSALRSILAFRTFINEGL